MRPRTRTAATLASGLAVGLAAAGCGSTSSSPGAKDAASTGTSASQSAAASASSGGKSATGSAAEKVPAIDLALRGGVKLRPIAGRYTCDGADVPPPLHWGAAPAGTTELDLFILSELPVNGKFDVAWAVASLNPHSRGVSSAALPPGAVLGRNGSGTNRYSLCPPKGSSGRYAVLLYALPHKVPVKPGFDASTLVEGTLVHIAAHEGEAPLSYKRS